MSRKPILPRVALTGLATAVLVGLPLAGSAQAETRTVESNTGAPLVALDDSFLGNLFGWGDDDTQQAQPQTQPRQLSAAELEEQREKAAEQRRERKLQQRAVKIDKVLDYVRDQLGEPYIWGGVGPVGFDCSGLTMRAYEKVGVDTGRTTWDQKDMFAERKVTWDDLKPGDLVFFNNDEHMGIVSRDGYMYNAPQRGVDLREEPLGAKRKAAFTGAVRPIA